MIPLLPKSENMGKELDRIESLDYKGIWMVIFLIFIFSIISRYPNRERKLRKNAGYRRKIVL